MRRAWKPVLAVAIAAAPVLAAVGTTFAAFSSTTAVSGSFTAKRIFSDERGEAAWQLEDAADGSAADKSYNIAFVDAVVEKTANWANTWSGTRYVEFELNSPLAAGLAVTGATFAFTFADDDTAGNTFCFYFEVRRTSDGTLLGVHGSTVSTIGCEGAGVLTTFTTSIPEITTSDLANDLTIRVYGMHSGGGKAIDIDRATVTGSTHNTFTLYPNHIVDAADTTPATTYWGPAKVNAQAFQNGGNWSNNYSTTRYLKFTFPAYVPGGGTVTSASFEYTYRSQNAADTTCYYFEVYTSSTLIGTHGSTSSDVDCNATASYETIATSLPEVDTATEARTLSIKLFSKVSGSRPTLTDGAVVKITYSLDSGVSCADPSTETVIATYDAHVEQNNPTNNYATGIDLKVRTKPSENKRSYVFFPLPSLPPNCTVTGATLRLYQNSSNSSPVGSRTVDVYQAAGAWAESTLTWNNQPGSTGTAATGGTSVGWREWVVTAHVLAMYSGSNNGFMLRETTEDDAVDDEQKYDSTEEVLSRPPELVVTIG